MMRWLQDNPIGLGLTALCGTFVLLMAVLGIVSLLPVQSAADAEAGGAGDEVLNLPQLGESAPIDDFYVITERPLFNESRQPMLDEELNVDPLADALQEEDPETPDVELSGVVITPSLRMVTLRRKDADQSLLAFEGRPIENSEFGSWQVSRVDAREVMLTSGSGEELLLKLKVHDEKIEPPDRPPPRQEARRQAQEDAEEESIDAKPLSRAEEIRQRIAERREELRRQAELEEQGDEEAATPNYREAIQSMIGRSRRNRENQDEQ